MNICFLSGSSGDLAHNKSAIQSSTFNPEYVAGNAVDGKSFTISATKSSQNKPFWSVDLGNSTYIDHLYITNYIAAGESFDCNSFTI